MHLAINFIWTLLSVSVPCKKQPCTWPDHTRTIPRSHMHLSTSAHVPCQLSQARTHLATSETHHSTIPHTHTMPRSRTYLVTITQAPFHERARALSRARTYLGTTRDSRARTWPGLPATTFSSVKIRETKKLFIHWDFLRFSSKHRSVKTKVAYTESWKRQQKTRERNWNCQREIQYTGSSERPE